MHEEHMHFIGIGGIGMSGVAKLILEGGLESTKVSGSDAKVDGSYVIDTLIKLGAEVYKGHDSQNLQPSVTHIVVSTDISQSNPELVEAKKRGIPVLHRSDALQQLMATKKQVLVSGTHGKTTTSSLLTHVLKEAGKDPSFAVGGVIKNYGTNAQKGMSDLFVAEADESDGTFLKYSPYAAIITNIDNDHLAHFGSMEALEKAFIEFCQKFPTSKDEKRLFACGDDERIRKNISNAILYGRGEHNDIIVENVRSHERGTSFDLNFKDGRAFSSITVSLFGEHNALNAAAVFALALELGCSEEVLRSSLLSFQGAQRRLDCLYTGNNGIQIFDDYAHHPTEVKATLNAVRKAFPSKRVVAVFQPHRPSRMQYVVDDFREAFQDADIIVLTDLYAASETSAESNSLQSRLINVVATSHETTPLHCVEKDLLVDRLLRIARPFDVIVFMGAGDSTILARSFKAKLEELHEVTKYKVGIVYGGMNSENKISRVSAQSIWSHLRADLFEKKAFLIETDGSWHDTTDKGIVDEKLVSLGEHSDKTAITPALFSSLSECDIFIPVLHGPFGEDGTIQGFFEILGKPYASSPHTGCAIAMDKAFSKQIAESVGVPVVPYVIFRRQEWEDDQTACLQKISKKGLIFPLFIKPVHLGSSIGIEKVETIEALIKAVKNAFEIDDKIVVENGLADFRELEFAPLGNELPFVPHAGEVLSEGRFYDYKAKYGDEGFATVSRSNLSDDVMEEGKALAKKVYQEMDLKVLTRVDFLLDGKGNWFFNEVNPMPGFTEISLYPSIWQASGLTYEDLISQLIMYGFQRYRAQRKLSYAASRAGLQMEEFCAV